MEDELPAKVDETLRDVLADAQMYASPQSIERSQPEKWLRAASLMLQGATRKEVQFDVLRGNPDAYCRIRAQLMESPVCGEIKRELAVRALQQINHTADISDKVTKIILDRISKDNSCDEMTPEQLMKMLKDLGVTSKLYNDIFMRVRGDNVQRIEVVKKDFNFEDMMKQVEALTEKQADVIELEDE